MNNEGVAQAIIALERAALDRWGKGDPSGYLAITAPDVTYFDPFLEKRLEALTRYYRASAERSGSILTFNYVSYGTEGSMRWNCTEAYCRDGDQWLIIQTHWAISQHSS